MSASAVVLIVAVGVMGTGAPTPQAAFANLREPPIIADCAAAPPAAGQPFGGTVLQVIDGRTICVAHGPTPSDWVRVEIDGAKADADRGALMAVSFGQAVQCTSLARVDDGVRARCRVAGQRLERAAASPAARRAGGAWR